ncbi:MAG: cytochrome c oxidase assembly protein [Brevundimonas sp.]|jgi:cytochrome c oxidase assembly protein subunit 11|uniref:cytochrome c oxidase assembly protein n=1 Tax=Brevundimonas sp. TaxID=1871086 RepID=UPI0039189A9B
MDKNARTALICVVVVAGMTGAAFAAVPLYQLFCQVTGFGGTVSRADEAPGEVLERTVTISFDTNVRGLEWEFTPEVRRQSVHIGETGIAYFRVTNTSDRPLSGTAAYNVVPNHAGPYFQKLQCFCFEDQTLQPGESMSFPVQYFVAPEMATDREGQGITNITLSYTFYPTDRFDQRAQMDARPGLGGQG